MNLTPILMTSTKTESPANCLVHSCWQCGWERRGGEARAWRTARGHGAMCGERVLRTLCGIVCVAVLGHLALRGFRLCWSNRSWVQVHEYHSDSGLGSSHGNPSRRVQGPRIGGAGMKYYGPRTAHLQNVSFVWLEGAEMCVHSCDAVADRVVIGVLQTGGEPAPPTSNHARHYRRRRRRPLPPPPATATISRLATPRLASPPRLSASPASPPRPSPPPFSPYIPGRGADFFRPCDVWEAYTFISKCGARGFIHLPLW